MPADTSVIRNPLKVILIAVILVLVTGSGLLYLANTLDLTLLYSVGHSIIMGGGIWIICRYYVVYLWRKFPWETRPVVHIIYEVIGLAIIANLYGLTLYRIEIRLNVIEPIDDLGVEIFITLLITYLITGIHEMSYFYKQWIRNFSKSVQMNYPAASSGVSKEG